MADAEDEAGGGAPVPIHENLLQEILLSGASHETRANPQALALTSALVGSFVEECWHRSAAEAEEVGDAVDIRGTRHHTARGRMGRSTAHCSWRCGGLRSTFHCGSS